MTKDIIHDTLENLNNDLRKREKHNIHSFEDFLKKISLNPEKLLRNSFQLLSDMVHYYVKEPENKNNYKLTDNIKYDCTELFVKDTENPFFADRLLANKLINVIDSLKSGVMRNKLLLFIGPRGSGKSTFLNNLLEKLEVYSRSHDGLIYDTLWEIDLDKIEESFGYNSLEELTQHNSMHRSCNERKICVPCPNHDHPIIQIPIEFRKHLLDEIIDDTEFKKKLFYSSEYEWVFQKTPCAICTSIYNILFEKLQPSDILDMLHARRYLYDRKTGEGITVYNPGDNLETQPLTNLELQKWLDKAFRSSNAISYVYSTYAKTNNGVFAIMDAKLNNRNRIKNIHTIISDGIHKVKTFEETIDSIFMTLMNPEDMEIIAKEKSFLDRIIKIPIPYIRDYMTEIEIYKDVYGEVIQNHFLPWILKTFAKIVISTRLNKSSNTVSEWIKNKSKYSKFCDNNLIILKMELYSGNIPPWLSDEDTKSLDKKTKQKIFEEGNEEGTSGVSGRKSLEIFNEFYIKYKKNNKQITIENLVEFCNSIKDKHKIDQSIIDSLINLYDYTVLQELKESMYLYNENQIKEDIQNYLFAINNEIGTTTKCPYTNDKLDITENYFMAIEAQITDGFETEFQRQQHRDQLQKIFVAKTLQEINAGKNITETNQFKSLLKKYNQNLKKNVLAPYVKNINFRRAIKDLNTDTFNNYDRKVKDEVKYLIKNLEFKFNYTETGAQQIALYVIDNDLSEKFPEN